MKLKLAEWKYLKILLHIIIWILLYLYVTFAFIGISAGLNYIIPSYIYFGLACFLPTYFNIQFLVPKYLFKRKFILYIVFLAVFIVLQCLIGTLTAFAISKLSGASDFIGVESLQSPLSMIPHMFFFNMVFIFGKLSTSSIMSQIKIENLEKERLSAELAALKNQLNPHFLFNALNTIYGLSLDNNKLTHKAVLELSDILRYILYGSNELFVSLEKELEFIESYLNFSKLRLRKNSEINFQITGNANNKKIMPLFFLPFIENAIKHGINSSITNSWVDITVDIQGETLHFQCRNNYRLAAERKDDSGGIGLENFKKRLNLLYKNKNKFLILRDNQIFEVDIEVELT